MNTIINNNKDFICKYDESQLPQLSTTHFTYDEDVDKNGNPIQVTVKTSDIDPNILISQIIGCAIREDEDDALKMHDAFMRALLNIEKSGEHGIRMSKAYEDRLQYALSNVHTYAAKYIKDWQEAKSRR